MEKRRSKERTVKKTKYRWDIYAKVWWGRRLVGNKEFSLSVSRSEREREKVIYIYIYIYRALWQLWARHRSCLFLDMNMQMHSNVAIIALITINWLPGYQLLRCIRGEEGGGRGWLASAYTTTMLLHVITPCVYLH